MHSFGYRVNELLKLAVKILAFICIFSSFSDICNLPDPTVDIQVVSFDSFVKTKDGDEEVNVTLSVTTDLKSLFTWNTKQVFVIVAAEYETPDNAVNQISKWDLIVESREHAEVQTTVTTKYSIFDERCLTQFTHCGLRLIKGSNLRGLKFNLTLHWHVMPKFGMMFTGAIQ